MNVCSCPDGVVRISFEIADLKTWVQIPVGALKVNKNLKSTISRFDIFNISKMP
jgi:hypothetical protein